MDIRTSHTTLDYPLYVCDFDPTDAGRLIVGGGGGASRTGVGNKIVRAQCLFCYVLTSFATRHQLTN